MRRTKSDNLASPEQTERLQARRHGVRRATTFANGRQIGGRRGARRTVTSFNPDTKQFEYYNLRSVTKRKSFWLWEFDNESEAGSESDRGGGRGRLSRSRSTRTRPRLREDEDEDYIDESELSDLDDSQVSEAHNDRNSDISDAGGFEGNYDDKVVHEPVEYLPLHMRLFKTIAELAYLVMAYSLFLVAYPTRRVRRWVDQASKPGHRRLPSIARLIVSVLLFIFLFYLLRAWRASSSSRAHSLSLELGGDANDTSRIVEHVEGLGGAVENLRRGLDAQAETLNDAVEGCRSDAQKSFDELKAWLVRIEKQLQEADSVARASALESEGHRSAVGELHDEIVRVSTRVDSVDNRVGTLESNVESHASSLGELHATDERLLGEIETLRGLAAALRESLEEETKRGTESVQAASKLATSAHSIASDALEQASEARTAATDATSRATEATTAARAAQTAVSEQELVIAVANKDHEDAASVSIETERPETTQALDTIRTNVSQLAERIASLAGELDGLSANHSSDVERLAKNLAELLDDAKQRESEAEERERVLLASAVSAAEQAATGLLDARPAPEPVQVEPPVVAAEAQTVDSAKLVTEQRETIQQWARELIASALRDERATLEDTATKVATSAAAEAFEKLAHSKHASASAAAAAAKASAAGVSPELLAEAIEQQLRILAEADGLVSMPDYALASAGARVNYAFTSPTYTPAVESLGDQLRAFVLPPSRLPTIALSPDTSVGQCWPMRGSSGRLTVELSQPLSQVSHVTVDHAPAGLAHDLSSAPRQMRVWAVGAGSTEGELVAEFSFLPENDQVHSQTFECSTRNSSELVDRVTFEVLTNNGNDNYTCLYRVRVHGVRANSGSN